MFNIGDMVCTNNKKLVGVITNINSNNTVILAVVWNEPPFAQGCNVYTVDIDKLEPVPKGTKVTLTTKNGAIITKYYKNFDNKHRALFDIDDKPLLVLDGDELQFYFSEDVSTKNNKQYTQLGIEPWDIMEADFTRDEFIGFLKGNIIKYCLRKKDSDLQDFEKIEHYARKLQEVLKGE